MRIDIIFNIFLKLKYKLFVDNRLNFSSNLKPIREKKTNFIINMLYKANIFV
jgi:hypothetical protein